MTARLTFMLGRAGTGKTHACLEAMRSDLREGSFDDAPLLLLTPEQATFQMEQALLAHPDIQATGRAQVLSFQRLAARVLQHIGGGAKPRLGELGKRMLLRALIQRHGDELQLFHRAARRTGFVDRLAGTFSELRQYNVKPDDLMSSRAAKDDDSGPLAAKIHDLSLLYKDYVKEVDERFTDPDELLNVVAAALKTGVFARGARIWVDGFAGFTPQEFAVLQALWSVADEMHIALCLDPALVTGRRGGRSGSHGAGAADLFLPTLETYDRLIEMAHDARVAIQPPVLFEAEPPPRFAADRLRHMERELFRRPGRPFPPEEAGGEERVESLRLVAAAGPRVEVETAAKRILHLARERGWRFRDMAVIVYDLTPYEDLITSVFDDLGIPYFVDSRRTLTHHPLTELLRSVLEAYAGGWPTEAVVRCLKTDFFPLRRDEVDRLENYALEHGIEGPGWIGSERWTYVRQFTLAPGATARGAKDQTELLAEMNALREQAVAPLRRVARDFGKAETVRDGAAALWDLLERLDVAGTLEHWIDAAEAEGRVDEAQEHRRAWQGVIQVLDELVHALGDVAMNHREFRQIVEAGLESLDVGMVPASLDQVMVGTVERSRQPDIKAAFVLGAADRHFPPPPGEDVIFTDGEREQLAAMQLQLSPTSREESMRQQYFLYMLLTRASDYLWVSYPSLDGQGKEQTPAATWRRLAELFPADNFVVETVEPDDDDTLLDRIVRPEELAASTALRLRRHRGGHGASPVWWALYDYVATNPVLRAHGEPLFPALDYRNDPGRLSGATAKALFGSPLRTSVSRLETFAACPFRHFAQHGLGLEERPRWTLDAAAKGTFLHAALSRFVELLEREEVDWADLTDERVAHIADEAVDELLPRLSGEILLSSARYAFLGAVLRSRVQRAVWALTAHARQGHFQPVAVEATFGRPGALWPGLFLDLGDGRELQLRGQIDRVDTAMDEDGRRWVRIIDYKSSSRNFPVGRIGHGLALQLPLYMAVVLRGSGPSEDGPLQPAGLLYFPVRDPLLRQNEPVQDDEWESLVRRALRMEGLLTDDVPVLRLMDEEVDGGSELIAVRVKKDGTVYASSNTASAEQFDLLLRFAEKTAADLGRDVLAGRIDVAPYRIGQERACTYCPLSSVCRFDPLIEGNTYRRLDVPGKADAWRQMEEAVKS